MAKNKIKAKIKTTTKISAREKIAATIKKQALGQPAPAATPAAQPTGTVPVVAGPAPAAATPTAETGAPAGGETPAAAPPAEPSAPKDSSAAPTPPTAPVAPEPAAAPAATPPAQPPTTTPDAQRNQQAAEQALEPGKGKILFKEIEPLELKGDAKGKALGAAAEKVGGEKAAQAAQAAKVAAQLAADYSSGNWGKMAADIWKNKKLLANLLWDALKRQFLAFFGWPVLVGCLVIFLVVLVIFGSIGCQAMSGYFGKSSPIPAGKNNTNVKTILASSSTGAKSAGGGAVSGHSVLELNDTDRKFIESGLIDKRLAEALKYLTDRHLSLKISHVVEGYEDMVGESGSDSNSQITANVSAHKDGLAADISTIDFVYKTLEEHLECADADLPPFDVVYYGDEGTKISTAETNTSTNPAPGDTTTTANDKVDDKEAKVETESEKTEQSLKEIQEILDSKCTNSTNEDVLVLKQKVAEAQTKLAEFRNKLKNAIESLKKLQAILKTITDILQSSGQSVPDELNDLNKYLQILLTNLEAANRVLVIVNTDLPIVTVEIEQIVSENCDELSQEGGKLIVDKFDKVISVINGLPDIPVAKDMSTLGPVIDGIVKNLETIVKENIEAKIQEVLGNIKPDLDTLGSKLSGSTKELLRLDCTLSSLNVNTNINGKSAEAIPIKVAWQDPKPSVQYVDAGAKDDCLTRESGTGLYGAVIGPRSCTQVFRPEAQRKIHNVISELLEFPYDMANQNLGSKFYWRVTQLITYSHKRDVEPFWDKLKDLYGGTRPANLGLFAMPEAWAQVHVAY